MDKHDDLIQEFDTAVAGFSYGGRDILHAGEFARLRGFREKLLQFREESRTPAAVADRRDDVSAFAKAGVFDGAVSPDATTKTEVTLNGAAYRFIPTPKRPERTWLEQYRAVVATYGLDSNQAASFIAAHADDPTFMGRVDAIRKAHEGHLKYEAALAADARSDARSAFAGKVGRLAWGLIKFASIASAAGYVGRLAWADLAARYFG